MVDQALPTDRAERGDHGVRAADQLRQRRLVAAVTGDHLDFVSDRAELGRVASQPDHLVVTAQQLRHERLAGPPSAAQHGNHHLRLHICIIHV